MGSELTTSAHCSLPCKKRIYWAREQDADIYSESLFHLLQTLGDTCILEMPETVDEKQKCFCPLQRIFVSWLKSDKLFPLEMPGVTGVPEIILHGAKTAWRLCWSAWCFIWLRNAKLRYCSLHKTWEKQLLSCQFISLSLQSLAASHRLQSGEVIWCDLALWSVEIPALRFSSSVLELTSSQLHLFWT